MLATDQRKTRNISRYKGLYWMLGALVFFFQGLFFLNDFVTALLFLVLEFVHAFVFQEHRPRNPPARPANSLLRFLVELVLTLIVLGLALGVWMLLWQTTHMPIPFIAALTAFAAGLIQLAWSYLSNSRRKTA